MKTLKVCKNSADINSTIKELIEKAIVGKDGHINVGLSGGSLVTILSNLLPQIQTDWSKWRFFFCDERLVPFDDPESTFSAYKKLLSPKIPVDLNYVTINPSMTGQPCADDYVDQIAKAFPGVNKANDFPQFDLLFLGMGPDGHTCSLFPGHPLLEEKKKWVAYIGDSPKPPDQRVTLTFPVLNNARNVIFIATGEAKKPITKEIFVNQSKLPAARVDPHDGVVYWILDEQNGQVIPPEIQKQYPYVQ